MPEPMRDFDLDNILSDSRIVPDAELKESLRARLQSIRKTAPPANDSNGWRRPSQVPYSRYIEEENKAMSNSRLIPAFAIVFAVILVVVLGMSVLGPGLTHPAAGYTPTPTPVPSTPVPPTPVPTEAPTVAPTPEEITFSSKKYKLPMSVSFGPDWQVIDDFTDLVTVAGMQKDWNVGFNIVTNAKVADPVSGDKIPFPQDFASWIKSNPDFTVNEPTEVMVAGIKGLQIDATPIATKQKDFLYMSGTRWNVVSKPEGWRFILLNDVNGERLLILLIAPADQFNVAAEQAQAVIDSVVFTK